ncbi:DUF3604 domain-containing protein [Halieaceae bacterium IMCC14734]|uniref:DUF3604 domain-containing protein n=1 Tax=Candidatus Litorirhabdus singularis TaxID=2518993 RepID=A0ABT3TLD0_9GAMM|nr:DUF3604 domain-containing protein [Candidatus Litorirhabdus singularis]MCX2982214.1 DUF3604 domain-containing protein [Candidatus Litorirhabdus singularis]
MYKTLLLRCALLALGYTATQVMAQDYTPWAEENFPMNVYWGDTHLHSSYSVDANTMGNTGLSPADAYRFARGEAVEANAGMLARLYRPLDFLVVSDHAEQLGTMLKLREGDARLLTTDDSRRVYKAMTGDASPEQAGAIMQEFLSKMSQGTAMLDSPEVSADIWQESIAISDAYNDPGNFTALIGFEWTSMPAGNNLHRVVIYADAADKAGQMQPLASNGGEDPANLWSFMERYEENTGGRILAIPHNGNLSNGRMFQMTDYSGAAIDAEYAARRLRHEPLVEVTQIKGDGETHPFLSPDDEFADFETWDGGNFVATAGANKSNDMLQYEYARSALKSGLLLASTLGINPYQFGMIGSTDSHTSLATGGEDNFWGKATVMEPAMPRTAPAVSNITTEQPGVELTMPWAFVASGYAAVWAQENTRESLFDAMRRKEVYATTGSRISLRFFGGWEYAEDDVLDPHFARIGYRKGVPMGGELGAPEGKAPDFMIAALKDPDGANLDRLQVVKGWLDDAGELHEKVYNVAASDGRRPRRNGSLKSLGNSVDLSDASYDNSIGATALATVWTDPDFDAAERAFYYARVIEIETPRWSEYDRVRLGRAVDPRAPTTVQDRAYSSPIWYSPR